MVNHPNINTSRRGYLELDLLVAAALLFVALMPLAYSFVSDQRAARQAYERAVAMELIDGEMEILVAGAWRNHPAGTNEFQLTGNATTNLSTTRALLIIKPKLIRLEWHTARRQTQGIIREVNLP
jgi:hypothetical protein